MGCFCSLCHKLCNSSTFEILKHFLGLSCRGYPCDQMYRITLTLNQNNDKVENVVFDDIEHLFVDHSADDDLDANIYLSISLIVYILIITTNGNLLYFFINQPNKTFLDWMMVCDTLLCISNIFGIGNIYKVLQSVEFCYFIPFFIYFTNICNRLLTVGIVIYRS